MSKERRLGRGLEALLGRAPEPKPAAVGPAEVVSLKPSTAETIAPPQQASVHANVDGHTLTQDSSGQKWLDVYSIDRNPFQPRQDFDEEAINGLLKSIKEHGVIQPLVVRKIDDRYQLITGERRLRAATKAGWERVPVSIREADNRQMAELAIVENVQRKDLNALEKAASFSRYLEEYDCSQEELAKRIHINRSTIANLIRLLDLPDSVKSLLRSGKISQGHARALLPLGDESEQESLAEKIVKERLSVRATEEAVNQRIRKLDGEPLAVVGSDGKRRAIPRTRTAHLASLEQELRTSLGTKVDVKQSSKGRGRITIHFTSEEEFTRLKNQLTVPGKNNAAGG